MRALGTLLAAVPFGSAGLRCLTTGSDVRYLWLASASSVGAAVVLSRARATLGGAAPE